jgi:DNA repair exonuclease SbcCD ATPase subunit
MDLSRDKTIQELNDQLNGMKEVWERLYAINAGNSQDSEDRDQDWDCAMEIIDNAFNELDTTRAANSELESRLTELQRKLKSKEQQAQTLSYGSEAQKASYQADICTMQKRIGNMVETIQKLDRKNQALETTRQAELRSHEKVAEELGKSKLRVNELETTRQAELRSHEKVAEELEKSKLQVNELRFLRVVVVVVIAGIICRAIDELTRQPHCSELKLLRSYNAEELGTELWSRFLGYLSRCD